MSLQMADEWLWVASFTIWPKGSFTLVVHVWFLFSPPTRLTMASHLKIKDNEARCYCSVHQGADISRGTLERVVHPYPLRHAHTWLRVPSHCLVIVQGLCVATVATDQRAHLEDARAWRASPRVGPCRVLPPQRVGVQLSLLRGWPNRDAWLGLNALFVFYRWGTHRERESRAVRMDVWYVFAPLFYPTPRGTLPWWKRNSRRSSDVSRRAIRTRSASGCWGFLPTWPNGIPRPRPCRPRNPGVLLEAGSRVPVYSEHSTRLRRNRSQVDKYKIKSQTNRNFFSPLSRLARGV